MTLESVRDAGNPNCRICGKPLMDPEVRLNRLWHFDCQKCQICGESMDGSSEQILKCLNDGVTVAHPCCLKSQMFADFRNKVLPLTKSHIDALNAEINSFFPAVNPDVADVKILYDLLISLQETATNVSYALALTKDKLLIRESRTFDHQTKQKQAVEKQARLEVESEKLDRQKRSNMFAAERENPTLRLRRKAIEGFMAIGLGKDQAEEMVRQQELKAMQGKENIQ